MAALAQDGDGLRADQAGAADDDDLHEPLLPFVIASFVIAPVTGDPSTVSNGSEEKRPQRRRALFLAAEETSDEARILNRRPLAV